jgi:hypothetical protein
MVHIEEGKIYGVDEFQEINLQMPSMSLLKP